jgi:hypothetical protein
MSRLAINVAVWMRTGDLGAAMQPRAKGGLGLEWLAPKLPVWEMY